MEARRFMSLRAATSPGPDSGLIGAARTGELLSPRQLTIVLGALAALFLLTRLALIGRLPYFIDEGTHAQFAYKGARSLHDLFISLTIGKEPLMIWVAVIWIKLGFAPLTAVRLASLASGLLTVPVVGLLGSRVAGPSVGLASAALCVVLPFFVVHDVIGIMEPLLTLLMAATLYVQINLARRPRLSLGVALGLVLGAILLTKQSGDLAAALLPLSLLTFDWHPGGRRERLRTWLSSTVIAGLLMAGAELLLRSSSYYGQLAAVRRSSLLYPVRSWSDAFGHPLSWWRLAWPVYRAALSGYVGVPLLCAAAVGGALMWRADRRMTLLLSGWVAIPFLAAVLFPVSPYPRHVMYLMPPILVLAAYALVRGGRWIAGILGTGWKSAAAAIVLPLLVVVASVGLNASVLRDPVTATYPGRDDVQYVTGVQAGAPWPAVSDLLRRRAIGSRVIIATDRADADIVQLLLGVSPRYVFVLGSSSLAQRAQFVLQDELPFPDPAGGRLIATGGFHLLKRLPRPRGGAVVQLYQRAPVWGEDRARGGSNTKKSAGAVRPPSGAVHRARL